MATARMANRIPNAVPRWAMARYSLEVAPLLSRIRICRLRVGVYPNRPTNTSSAYRTRAVSSQGYVSDSLAT